MVPPSIRPLLAAGLAVLSGMVGAGCADDDDAGPSVPDVTGGATVDGCPLGEAIVTEALGYAMAIDGDASGEGTCVFVALDQADHAGASVRIEDDAVEDGAVAIDGLTARLEQEVAPVESLPGDLVDGADDGYLLRLGHTVQIGVVADDRLVVLTLVEPALEPDAARDHAAELLERALS